MKRKTLFIAALVGLGSIANAQTTQMTNDEGLIVTPEAGDWAIGINASPLLNYVGNAFNSSTTNNLGSNFNSGNKAIYGKYFTDENTAYRASIRLMTASSKTNAQIDTNTLNSAPSYVTNTAKYSGGAIVIGFGIEKRKGHNKLQGFYGAELNFTLGGTTPKTEYTYEVPLTDNNITNNSYNVAFSDDPNIANSALNGRVLKSKEGATIGFGVRGFIGAEYFFAPKVSVAAEYGWGLGYTTTGAGETTSEYFGLDGNSATSPTNYEVVTTTGKSSSFRIDTDNLGGAIRLMFHF